MIRRLIGSSTTRRAASYSTRTQRVIMTEATSLYSPTAHHLQQRLLGSSASSSIMAKVFHRRQPLSRQPPQLRISHSPPRNRSTASSTSSSSSSSSLSSLSWMRPSPEPFSSSIEIKPWPVPKVIARGDYRDEVWLEAHIGGPLYAHQDALPRLPVPSIEDTLQRMLPTAGPLATSNSERQALQAAMHTFPTQSAHLQQRLLQRAASEPIHRRSSWLQHWWNTVGYLHVRDPITIHVSYFFHLADDPSARTGIQRAAALLQATALFRQAVVTGQWPAPHLGAAGTKKKQMFLDSTAYKYMFHTCRIPQTSADVVHLYDPSRYRHALVMRRGHAYTLDFCDAQGRPFPLECLERALMNIQRRADNNDDTHGKSHSLLLGYLTSSPREDWAVARHDFLQHGGAIAQFALERIESAALCICLDASSPVSRQQCASQFWLGGDGHGKDNNDNGTKINEEGRNRWMDKSIQLVVTDNGKAGLIGEHSMMDGMPVVDFADCLTKHMYGSLCGSPNKNDEAGEAAPENEYKSDSVAATAGGDTHNTHNTNVQAVFDNNESSDTMDWSFMLSHVQNAQQHYQTLTGQHSLHVLTFHGYGSDYIKQSGFSPDAFVQLAMQLATYRLWNGQNIAGTYEATQVRPFLHGRTETTRSVSTHSAEFCRRMGLQATKNPKYWKQNKENAQSLHTLLQESVQSHVAYMRLAAQAQGVDRHFFGLSMLARDGETLPDLFHDPVFQRSKRWRVSTSHLTHPRIDGWGFGEVVPDGVGLAYSIHPRHCVFNITALKEHDWTEALSQHVEDALLEMRSLVETTNPPPGLPRSKL